MERVTFWSTVLLAARTSSEGTRDHKAFNTPHLYPLDCIFKLLENSNLTVPEVFSTSHSSDSEGREISSATLLRIDGNSSLSPDSA